MNTTINTISTKDENSNLTKEQLKKYQFFSYFSSFASQAVIGTLVAFWNVVSNSGKYDKLSKEEVIKKFIQQTEIKQNLINYFNQCWKRFHLKSDDYVFAKMSMIMFYGKFKHESCAFGFVWDFIQNMLKLTLLCSHTINFTNRNLLIQSVKYIVEIALEIHKDDIINKVWGCDDNCKVYVFKSNEDFLYFTK